MKPNSVWNRILGGWRVRRGYCPQCNLDAPSFDTCAVCRIIVDDEGDQQDRRMLYAPYWPVNQETKDLWWKRWLELNP